MRIHTVMPTVMLSAITSPQSLGSRVLYVGDVRPGSGEDRGVERCQDHHSDHHREEHLAEVAEEVPWRRRGPASMTSGPAPRFTVAGSAAFWSQAVRRRSG